MAPGWLTIGSTELDSKCGEDGNPQALAGALNGSNHWGHSVNEKHWFILDLGASYYIEKMRSRSILAADPIDVDVYISDTKGVWGSAVATGISVWQDASNWVEYNTTDKSGRYIYVYINTTEDGRGAITWGKASPSAFTIFDVYGELTPTETNFETKVGGETEWTWQTATINVDKAPRGPTGVETEWNWEVVQTDSAEYIPSGNETDWKWSQEDA